MSRNFQERNQIINDLLVNNHTIQQQGIVLDNIANEIHNYYSQNQGK